MSFSFKMERYHHIWKNRYFWALVLFLVCFIGSLVLALRVPDLMCKDGGCDKVQNSEYAKTFGIKNGWFGIPIFAFMIWLAYLQMMDARKKRAKWLLVLSAIGSLVAFRFIYLQVFVLNAYCFYCMIVDVSMIIALFILLLRKV